jgi:ribosomal protein L37E
MTVRSIGKSTSVEREVICRRCGEVLRYTPSDIIEHVTTDYTGSKDTEYYVKCVGCNSHVYIEG